MTTALHGCGTYGGYVRHIRAGEPTCAPCREANRNYMAEYRNQNPEVREKDIAGLRARREATRLLIERHEAEFRALLADITRGVSA